MTKLEEVRESVMEAVPEARRCKAGGCWGMPCTESRHRPITLADVLRAITSQYIRPVKWSLELDNGILYFVHQNTRSAVRWNLALPLDEQEPEVIEFLHKILTKEDQI